MSELFLLAPWLFYVGLALLGLMVGSFLNVVIYRLPIMMQREWDAQLAAATASDDGEIAADASARFNLATPRSACPDCKRMIRAHENVPVLSYLFLRGRCAGCGNAISARYPLVEAFTGAMTFAVAWHFGIGIEALAAIALTWALIALTGIDIDHQLLPDSITLPLLWLGLFLSLFDVPAATTLFIAPADAIIGALAGYLSLWSVYKLFLLLTGKHGMGYGDFKLLAALGAWLGWQMLPMIILLSAAVGAIFGIGMIALGRQQTGKPMPFGPWLAFAGWITLLYGAELNAWYLGVMGL